MEKELMPWHLNWLVDPDYNRVDLVKEGANSGAHIKLFKSKGGTGMSMKLEEILKGLKPEHASTVQKALDDAAQAVTDATAEVEKAKKAAADAKANKPDGDAEDMIDGGSDESIEKVLKSVKDPAVRTLMEQQIAKAKAAETVVKELKDKEASAEAITKAKEVPNLGAEEAKLAEVYKALKTTNPQLADDVFGIFKSASALVNAGGVFTEVGKGSGSGAPVGGGDEAAAWAQIEKAADGIVAVNKDMKRAAAITKAIQDNPSLYNEYLKAQQG